MQEEDPGYAADKLQAADELRQWSEAAQCSSIACLVGEHFSFPAACHAVLGKVLREGAHVGMTQVCSSAAWPYEVTSCVLCPRAKKNGTLVCSGLCVMHGLAELSVRLHAWCCQWNLRGCARFYTSIAELGYVACAAICTPPHALLPWQARHVFPAVAISLQTCCQAFTDDRRSFVHCRHPEGAAAVPAGQNGGGAPHALRLAGHPGQQRALAGQQHQEKLTAGIFSPLRQLHNLQASGKLWGPRNSGEERRRCSCADLEGTYGCGAICS